MKKLPLIFCIFASLFLHAQNVRWDLGGPTTGVTSVSGYGQQTILAVPNVQLNWCYFPSNGGVNQPCSNYAPTYPSFTSTSACSTSSPIVLQGGSSCVAASDIYGNMGTFVTPGIYSYTLTVGANTYGPFWATPGLTNTSPETAIASSFGGADGGAKINAALAISNEVIVDTSVGPLNTAVNCGTGQHIHFLPGTYPYAAQWTLGTGCELDAAPQSINYDPYSGGLNFPNPAVVLLESNSANLPCSFKIAGMSVSIDSIAFEGNFGATTGNVGFCTDTTSIVNGSRGFLKMRRSTVALFSGDGMQASCTSSGATFYNQALSWQITDSTFTRNMGNDLTLQGGCTDLRLTDNYFALAGGYCIRNINSTMTVHGGDISSCQEGGIYETGSGQYENSIAAMVIDGVTGFEEPGVTSGANASLNGAIVIQGYDGTYCNGANNNRIVNTTFVSPGPPTQNNAFDIIHIENANNNTISDDDIEGEPAGSSNEARYAYFHSSANCSQTAGGDILLGNQFTGQFGTGGFSPTAPDIFAANNETAQNSSLGVARLTNHYLPNTAPFYGTNSSNGLFALISTDGSDNTTFGGDSINGTILLQPHSGHVNGELVMNGLSAHFVGGLAIRDQGTCTMTAGTCSAQSLSYTYASAPNCFANWTGTGTLTGFLKVPSSTTSVTPASSVNTDTDQVNWACFGN